eukprot:TRINITY_DN6194_c0_g1_i1.p1 TRINITY_DN6194_c0_g1~~TRINITY_DN6194_c0_g1_i1.p1  ORF type:complete len:171 (-),score=22.82 TRINITY_DN6194_c0_g1_i1:93-605(-)
MAVGLRFAILFAVLLVVAKAYDELATCSHPAYKQTNPEWENDQLPCGQTIGEVGCAETSVTMCIGGSWNPGTLNSWLIKNNGYEGCNIIWSAVDPLGAYQYTEQKKFSLSDLQSGAADCKKCFIANVRNGTHWVLIVGFKSGDEFYVQDPYFNQDTYTYSEMVTESLYTA